MARETEREYFSITDIARMQNVTTETLRHYDRIGILEPAYINEHGKRFYTPQQYEALGTIRDLAQSGIELTEIKDYLDNRTLETSRELLHLQQARLHIEIEKLHNMLQMVSDQSHVLDAITQQDYVPEVKIREFPQRYYLISSTCVHDTHSLVAGCHELEEWFRATELGRRIPVYATNVFAAMWQLDNLDECKVLFISKNPFTALRNESNLALGTLPAGKYLCVRHAGSLWRVKDGVKPLLEYLEENGLKAATEWVVDCVVVDWTVTSREEERLYDLQLPIL